MSFFDFLVLYMLFLNGLDTMGFWLEFFIINELFEISVLFDYFFFFKRFKSFDDN